MAFVVPKLSGLVLAAVLLGVAGGTPVFAQGAQVLVTVNDVPITSFDVQQRINLWKLLGRPVPANSKQAALDDLINDVAKIEEAKKYRAEASEKEVDARLAEVAKQMKTDSKGLGGKLKAQGIAMSAMRQYLMAQISFSRILRGKYKENVTVSKDEVDRKLAEFKADLDGRVRKAMADPRMQPINVYQLMEVDFPIDAGPDGMSPELLQSRALEASQFVSRFKSCGSARSAASGIFNVKIGRTIEADGRRIPPPMKKLLDKTKAGRAIGPMRSPKGIQVIGFCGTRKIVPPKPNVTYPTRDQVENVLLNEKYATVEDKYARQFRKNLMIEFRDPSNAN